MYFGKIIHIAPGSLAEELELSVGDKILEVNGMNLRDIIDLSFALAEEEIDLLVEHADGEQEMISFDKDPDEELGAEFESAVFDGIRKCANNCYFCFVNMRAPGMRESLAVKDDDYRMSFLYGNFITMTNMVEVDFRRIEQFHLSPLFVSVQAICPELRAQMMRCKRAGRIKEQLARLETAGAHYHTQVVLCAGLNDGEELDRTIRELMERRPFVLSLAIVPVGITKFRSDPYPLQTFDRESAAQVIAQVEPWQEKMRAETGRTMIYLSDEFYLLAGQEVPPAEYYDGFPQLENGIGLTRNFLEEWKSAINPVKDYDQKLYLDVIAGCSIAPVLEALANEAEAKLPHLHVRVLHVENEYFGKSVNVSGLLTGQDILAALERVAGPRHGVLLPGSCLRAGEDIFLDDYSLAELRQRFPEARIASVQGGADYWQALTDWPHFSNKGAGRANYMWQSNAAYTKPAE